MCRTPEAASLRLTNFRPCTPIYPKDLLPVMRFAFLTGWRKEESLSLTWDRNDFTDGNYASTFGAGGGT